MRFEDIISDPYTHLKRMFEFILGVEDIEGTYIDHRIKEVLKNKESSVVYKPRTAAIFKNLDKFSDE